MSQRHLNDHHLGHAPGGTTMAPLRILLTGPVATVASMAHYLYLSRYDTRWERDDEVSASDVRACDVFIADIGLKGSVGCDFVRSLTEHQIRRPVVIVISSESEQPPKEPGIDAHLVKPVDPEVLRALLERLQRSWLPSAVQHGSLAAT
jgi:DNA-binding response OmpR family regulator